MHVNLILRFVLCQSKWAKYKSIIKQINNKSTIDTGENMGNYNHILSADASTSWGNHCGISS